MGHPVQRKFVIVIDGVPTYRARNIQEIVERLSEHYSDNPFVRFTRHTVYQIRNGLTKKYQHIQIREDDGGSLVIPE